MYRMISSFRVTILNYIVPLRFPKGKSIAMIRRLHETLGIPAEVLIRRTKDDAAA